MTVRITSASNPRVKGLVRLRTRRERDRTGRFLIEGFRELSRAVEGGIEIEEVYFAPSLFLGDSEEPLLHRLRSAGVSLVELTATPFGKVSYRDRPEGLVAVARRFSTELTGIKTPPQALLLIVESIEKPGNLGTMIRAADAAGASAVVVCDPTTDVFNPNVVRASLGALFLVPIAVAKTTETIAWLSSHSIASFAATPRGKLLYTEGDYRRATALIVGSEQLGLSPEWIEEADETIRIPMSGHIDSLNAALSAAILLFEAIRQRTAA